MPNRTAATLFFLCAGTSLPAWCGVGIDCYGSLASYKLTHPSLNCTCTSATSMPSCSGASTSTRSTKGKYPSVKATMGAAIVGAALASILADPGPSAQELEQARQKAEAERLAALARAKEEEARHQKLIGSLISVPGTGAPPASGVRLTALEEPAAFAAAEPGPAGLGDTASPGTDEEARAWLANPETLFNAVWKPLAVGAPLPPAPPALPACQKGQGCEIPAAPAGAVAVAGVGKLPPRATVSPNPDKLGQTVMLLRPQSCTGRCDDLPYFLRAISASGLSPEQLRQAMLVTTLDQLKQTGKALIESMALTLSDALPNKRLAKVGVLYYNVADTANTILQDTIKAAGYLGSADPNASLPAITPFEEVAAPFAGETEKLSKLVVESAFLAQKLRHIWMTKE